MKSLKFVLGMSLSIGLLASCSKEERKAIPAKDTKMVRPQQLNFSKPAAGAELTKAQVNELKAVFAKPAMELPPSSMLLKDEDSKLDENELADLKFDESMLQYTASPETYALYQSMRKSCRKQHGTLNLEMTFPLEKIVNVTDLKTGDKMVTSAWGEYGGKNCDVEAAGNLKYGAKVDRLETDGVVSGEASYSLKALMNNPKYASLLKSKGIVATSSISGVVAKQNVNTKDPMDAEANLSFSIIGSYYTLSSEIPVASAYSIYAKPLNDISAEIQMEIKMKIVMPKFTANVIAQIVTISYKDGVKPSENKTERYYVNGIEKSKEEIQELFGDALKAEKSDEMTKAFIQ